MEPILLRFSTSDYLACLNSIFSEVENEPEIGDSCSPVPDSFIALEDVVSVKGIHDTVSSSMLELALTFSGSVATNLISSWLYDVLKKNNVKKLIVEETEVSVDIDEIDRVLTVKMFQMKRMS
jgi:hypothetical protein